jgi:uncharacterized membrane protein
VSRYDWLLFLHVLAAFALVASLVIFTTLFTTTRAAAATGAAPLVRISWLASRLWETGTLGTLVFGLWLAIDPPPPIESYGILDGWIIAALVLWFIASGSGSQVVSAYTEARSGGDLSALRTPRATSQHIVMILAATLLLVDMIFKPGA